MRNLRIDTYLQMRAFSVKYLSRAKIKLLIIIKFLYLKSYNHIRLQKHAYFFGTI